MQVIHELDQADASLRGCVLAIGNFDGLHIGHQRIFSETRRLADLHARKAVVMSFNPHPAALLYPQRAPAHLSTPRLQHRWLARRGIDAWIVLRTDERLLRTTAEQFIIEWIVPRLTPSFLVEGPTFGFGRGRAGDVRTLAKLGKRCGFELKIVERASVVLSDGVQHYVNSSLVRNLLSAGRVADAVRCLGRPYVLSGVVVRGAGRGRKLGFPTANLGQITQLLPPSGVYAGRCRLQDRFYLAAISTGGAPSFGQYDMTVEAHILDFDGDLTGQLLELGLVEWLRPQERFASAERLAEQIRRDCRRVRELFSGNLEDGRWDW